MEGQLSLKMMMHGLLIPVRQDPAALKWGLSVSRSRFNQADTFPVHGYRIDYTNQRIILHTWSTQYQSSLLDPKDVADMLDNRIG